MKKLYKSITCFVCACLMIIQPSNCNLCHACSCRDLELCLFGGRSTPSNDEEYKRKIEIYKQNFMHNFDTVINELKKIFSDRHCKTVRGPDWFYNPISDEQFSNLKKALPILLTKTGYEFSDTKDFWEEYKALRPASKSHPSCRLKDLITEGLTENKDITIHKHHIIPYCLGGAGTPLNCIELFEDEHQKIHSVICKVVRGEIT